MLRANEWKYYIVLSDQAWDIQGIWVCFFRLFSVLGVAFGLRGTECISSLSAGVA